MIKYGPAAFRLGALSNFVVTIPAIIAPRWATSIIGLEGLSDNGLFLLRIWAAMALLWGLMFLEIATDLRAHKSMLKYAWLEKSITAACVTIAFLAHQIDPKVFYMVLITDHLWIPLFLFYDVTTRGNPGPTAALLEAADRLRLGAAAS